MPSLSLMRRLRRRHGRMVTSRKGSTGDPRHSLGRDGEDAAARYLERKGYGILARNVRLAFGELDIVARDGATIVFVEVKTRRGAGALEAVDVRKQRRLTRLALAFIAIEGLFDRPARFDVVAVTPDGACTHVENAFDCVAGPLNFR